MFNWKTNRTSATPCQMCKYGICMEYRKFGSIPYIKSSILYLGHSIFHTDNFLPCHTTPYQPWLLMVRPTCKQCCQISESFIAKFHKKLAKSSQNWEKPTAKSSQVWNLRKNIWWCCLKKNIASLSATAHYLGYLHLLLVWSCSLLLYMALLLLHFPSNRKRSTNVFIMGLSFYSWNRWTISTNDFTPHGVFLFEKLKDFINIFYIFFFEMPT